jgi:preprotein translocase subunit SecA
LNDLESVEQDVHLRAYAQQDPFVAFRTEAARMFGGLMTDIELTTIRAWLSVQITENTATASRPSPQKKASNSATKKKGAGHKSKQKRHGKRIAQRTAPVPA